MRVIATAAVQRQSAQQTRGLAGCSNTTGGAASIFNLAASAASSIAGISWTGNGQLVQGIDNILGWLFRSRYNTCCSQIADAFWNSGTGWLEKFIGGGGNPGYIFSHPEISDAQIIATVQQECQKFHQMLSKVPYCGGNSAAQRPCSGNWSVPGVTYPDCCQGVDSYVSHQLSVRAAAGLNGGNTILPNTNLIFGLTPEKLLLYGGIGLVGLLLIKKMLE